MSKININEYTIDEPLKPTYDRLLDFLLTHPVMNF